VAELAEILRGYGRVGLDTSPFIYNLEGSLRFSTAAGEAFDALAHGDFLGVT
jgi:hypothetical protein